MFGHSKAYPAHGNQIPKQKSRNNWGQHLLLSQIILCFWGTPPLHCSCSLNNQFCDATELADYNCMRFHGLVKVMYTGLTLTHAHFSYISYRYWTGKNHWRKTKCRIGETKHFILCTTLQKMYHPEPQILKVQDGLRILFLRSSCCVFKSWNKFRVIRGLKLAKSCLDRKAKSCLLRKFAFFSKIF